MAIMNETSGLFTLRMFYKWMMNYSVQLQISTLEGVLKVLVHVCNPVTITVQKNRKASMASE